MNLTDKFFGLIGFFGLVFLIALPAHAQQDTFEKLTSTFEEGNIFHAEFSHEFIDSYTGDTTSSEGKIWVGENNYKVQTETQTVVVDGEVSRVYDSNRNRLIISEYEPAEDDFAPSRILNGADTTFAVEGEEQRSDETYLTLTSDDPFAAFTEIEITLNQQMVPSRIFAVDPSENEIVTTFTNGEFLSPQPEMLELQYPEDAEVVDMRN